MSASFTLFVADAAPAAQVTTNQNTAPAAPAQPAKQETAAPAQPAKQETAAPAQDATQATTEQPANPETPPQEEPSFLSGFLSMLPMILIIVVMFYLMYRGQKKEQKRRQDMITSITKGTKLVTIGGIHGTVFEVKEETFVITVAANTNIEISKAAVASVEPVTTTIEAAQK